MQRCRKRVQLGTFFSHCMLAATPSTVSGRALSYRLWAAPRRCSQLRLALEQPVRYSFFARAEKLIAKVAAAGISSSRT